MTIPFDNSCDSLLLQWFLSPTTQRSHKFILYISHDKKDFWMLVAITYLPTHKLSFMRSHLYGLPNDLPPHMYSLPKWHANPQSLFTFA